MKQQKISVIVPVYKAERYLRTCLDSIAAQTYDNLEIILVDDGSPDDCGAICEEYAAKDPRFVVIHQENAGVAQARNAGLRAASGDWIGWVDSDDWIEPDMYEKMLDAALEHDAQIAMCGAQMHLLSAVIPYGCCPETVMDQDAIFGEFLRNRCIHSELWSKLWRRELFDGIVFPPVAYYEDLAILHRLFLRTDRLAAIPAVKYHYRKNDGSITMDLNLSKCILNWKILHQRNLELLPLRPQDADIMHLDELQLLKQAWAWAWIDRRKRTPEQDSDLAEMAAFARTHRHLMKHAGDVDFVSRASMHLVCHDHGWFYFLAATVRRIYLFIKHRILKR